jgi:hypothetical protein
MINIKENPLLDSYTTILKCLGEISNGIQINNQYDQEELQEITIKATTEILALIKNELP